MFYLRLILIVVWFLVCSFLWGVMSVLRWGNLDNNHDMARFFGRTGLKLAGIRVECEGLELLYAHQPCVYVTNHQSALDVLTFGSIFPRHAIVIGKKELFWIPFFGIAFKAAGNVLIDRGNRKRAIGHLGQAIQVIQERKASVLIFPEGTRNRSGEGMLPFKKGAFHMAIEGHVPVVPIVCQSLRAVQGGKVPGTLRVKILPPIPDAAARR